MRLIDADIENERLLDFIAQNDSGIKYAIERKDMTMLEDIFFDYFVSQAAVCNKDRQMLENMLEEYLPGSAKGQNRKKRVYLSGPITGVSNYEENFKSAEEKLKEKGFETLNPVSVAKSLPEWMGYEDYLGVDLYLMNLCSSIYLLKGWEQSKGANREYGYALAKGMEALYE